MARLSCLSVAARRPLFAQQKQCGHRGPFYSQSISQSGRPSFCNHFNDECTARMGAAAIFRHYGGTHGAAPLFAPASRHARRRRWRARDKNGARRHRWLPSARRRGKKVGSCAAADRETGSVGSDRSHWRQFRPCLITGARCCSL